MGRQDECSSEKPQSGPSMPGGPPIWRARCPQDSRQAKSFLGNAVYLTAQETRSAHTQKNACTQENHRLVCTRVWTTRDDIWCTVLEGGTGGSRVGLTVWPRHRAREARPGCGRWGVLTNLRAHPSARRVRRPCDRWEGAAASGSVWISTPFFPAHQGLLAGVLQLHPDPAGKSPWHL